MLNMIYDTLVAFWRKVSPRARKERAERIKRRLHP